MKKQIIEIIIATLVATGYFFSSCGEEAKEVKKDTVVVAEDEAKEVKRDTVLAGNREPRIVKRTARGKDKLVDENEFYKVFIRWDEYDSISFSVVWMLDKKDSTRIIVTDPATYFYKYTADHVDADTWYSDPRVECTDNSKSIGNASEAKLISGNRHPWKLALHCSGWRHNFSTMIVTENDTSYIELDNQSYLGKSKYEDVLYFNLIEDGYDYARRFHSVLVLYNSKFRELRRKNVRIDYTKTDGSGSAKRGKAGGVRVEYDSIKNVIGTYDVSWAFDGDNKAKVYDTQVGNGDIVSYVVLQPGNKTYRMPSNDGFVDGVIEGGLLFQSYGTREDGSRYAILEVYDCGFRKIYEVDGRGK